MMYIGIKVAYDDEGRPEERFFTVRFWRFEFRFELSLQPAIDALQDYANIARSVASDPALGAAASLLEYEIFRKPPGTYRLVGLSAVDCECHEEQTPEGPIFVICSLPGCQNIDLGTN